MDLLILVYQPKKITKMQKGQHKDKEGKWRGKPTRTENILKNIESCKNKNQNGVKACGWRGQYVYQVKLSWKSNIKPK